MRTKHFLLGFLFFLAIQSCTAQSQYNKIDYIYVANWNLENLFDTIDDPLTRDEEFLPNSRRNWNEQKLARKLNHLSRVIQYMNDGDGPDILGVEEVEHKKLVKMLIGRLTNKKYNIVYAESPDKRGIDVGLIYNSNVFNLIQTDPLRIKLPNGRETRFILHVTLNMNKQFIHIFVNHWPSRREGLKKSEPNRIVAAETLRKKINSIFIDDPEAKIIVLGDFNDLPSNLSISKILRAKNIKCDSTLQNNNELVNLSYPLFQKGEGSYKFRDHWNMLDQIIISKSIFNKNLFNYVCNSFEIIKPPFMISHSYRWEGTPFPTYGGRKYLGGYSDHFPVGALFKIGY